MQMDVAGPVGEALAALAAALDAVVASVSAGGLDHLDDDGLLAALTAVEGIRNRLPVLDHELVAEVAARDLPERYGQGRASRLLAQLLRLSSAEAARRVRAAEALGPRRSMLGEPMAPIRPVLAAAQAAGSVTPEQVDLVLRGLATVDRAGFDPADVTAGEASLTTYATVFGPRDLATCVDRFVELLDPDGSVPDEQLQADRRHLELRRLRDGSWRGELRLTGAAGAKLAALLEPLCAPRASAAETADGRPVEEADPRTYGQRRHDALEEVCDRMLRAGALPESGGVPATVLVTIGFEELASRTGCGTTSDGFSRWARSCLPLRSSSSITDGSTCLLSRRADRSGPIDPAGARLSVATVLALAEEAEVIPVVLNAWGCHSAWVASGGSRPGVRPSPWSPGTAAAASPGVTGHRAGASGTTSRLGQTVD